MKGFFRTENLFRLGLGLLIGGTMMFTGCGEGEVPPDKDPDSPTPPSHVVDEIKTLTDLVNQKPIETKEFFKDIAYHDMLSSVLGQNYDEANILCSAFSLASEEEGKITDALLTFVYKTDETTRRAYVVNAKLNAKIADIANYTSVEADKFFGPTDMYVDTSFEYDALEDQRYSDYAEVLQSETENHTNPLGRLEFSAFKFDGVKNGKYNYRLFSLYQNRIHSGGLYTTDKPLDSENITYQGEDSEILGCNNLFLKSPEKENLTDTFEEVLDQNVFETKYENHINKFIEYQKDLVLNYAQIPADEVTSVKFKLNYENVISSQGNGIYIKSVTFQISSENQTQNITTTIENTFNNPISITSIANQSIDNHSGVVMSYEIANATMEKTSQTVTEKNQNVTIEDILSDDQLQEIVNQNLMPALEKPLKVYFESLYGYDQANIVNYRWALGEADTNGCVQNLKVQVIYQITYRTTLENWLGQYTIKLIKPISLNDLAKSGTDIGKASWSEDFSFPYTPSNQQEYSELTEMIVAKLAEEDKTFDYANVRRYQNTWKIGAGAMTNNIVFIGANGEIKNIRVSVTYSSNVTTNEQAYQSALENMRQGKWNWGIAAEVELIDNQLDLVDNTSQKEKE